MGDKLFMYYYFKEHVKKLSCMRLLTRSDASLARGLTFSHRACGSFDWLEETRWTLPLDQNHPHLRCLQPQNERKHLICPSLSVQAPLRLWWWWWWWCCGTDSLLSVCKGIKTSFVCSLIQHWFKWSDKWRYLGRKSVLFCSVPLQCDTDH